MRVLLILTILGSTIYLPIVSADTGPVCAVHKGIGGPIDRTHMAQVGATWRMNWSLCTHPVNPPNPGAECVSWVQYWGQYMPALGEELMTWGCPSGWIGFGDEWRLWGYYHFLGDWPMSRMLADLHKFASYVDGIRPECKIAFGGFLVWHYRLNAQPFADWVHDFYTAYLLEYGEQPPIDAFVLDNYQWRLFNRDWHADTAAAVNAIHDAFYEMDLEIWFREVGALCCNQADVLVALDDLGAIAPFADRWAWFTSYAEPWPLQNAFTSEWKLTTTGAALAQVDACPPKPPPPLP